MAYLWASVLVVVNTVWLVLVLFGLPGNWLMVATTALVAWWRWDPGLPANRQMFSIPVLAAVLLLAVVGEVLEFAAGMAGARRAGGSGWAVAAALLGGLIGAVVGTFAIPIPLVGTLVGACLGSAGGAWVTELAVGKPMRPAVRSGVGAGVGRLLGTLGKFLIGAMLWLLVAVAAFWP